MVVPGGRAEYIVTVRHRGPRAVLAVGVLAGVVTAVGIPLVRPAQVGIATDVYHHAATAALAGGDFYAVTPPDHPRYSYRYPPIVVLVFVPYGLAGSVGAHASQTVLNLLAVAWIGWLSVRTVESAGIDLTHLDRVLVVGFAVGSTATATNLVMGQINPILAAGIAFGGATLVREPSSPPGSLERTVAAGAAIGLAALVKPFLAVVGVWLLLRRAWMAVATAVAVGTLGLGAGVLVFGPEVTVTYLTTVAADQAATGTAAGRYDPASEMMTLRRQVAFLAPWIAPSWRFAVAAGVLAPVVLAAYNGGQERIGGLVTLTATLIAMLLVVPLEPFYLVVALYPTLPLVYLLAGWPRRVYLTGFVLTWTTVTLATVQHGVALAPVPNGIAGSVLSVARAGFTLVLPPTLGAVLLLIGCAWWGLSRTAGGREGGTADGSVPRAGRDQRTEPAPVGTDSPRESHRSGETAVPGDGRDAGDSGTCGGPGS